MSNPDPDPDICPNIDPAADPCPNPDLDPNPYRDLTCLIPHEHVYTNHNAPHCRFYMYLRW